MLFWRIDFVDLLYSNRIANLGSTIQLHVPKHKPLHIEACADAKFDEFCQNRGRGNIVAHLAINSSELSEAIPSKIRVRGGLCIPSCRKKPFLMKLHFGLSFIDFYFLDLAKWSVCPRNCRPPCHQLLRAQMDVGVTQSSAARTRSSLLPERTVFDENVFWSFYHR